MGREDCLENDEVELCPMRSKDMLPDETADAGTGGGEGALDKLEDREALELVTSAARGVIELDLSMSFSMSSRGVIGRGIPGI